MSTSSSVQSNGIQRPPKRSSGSADTITPGFESPEAEAAYFETHSTLAPPEAFVTLAPVEVEVRGKRRTRKLISLRIFPHQLERVKRVAECRGMPYQTLIQLWLAEKLAEEDSQ